jgi:UDP:flavonoid glycosyltransferase YjiC (YdhE family)
MKVLVVATGSQGDVYPHIALAKRLMERGHTVLLDVPFQFAELAKSIGVPCMMKQTDVKGFVAEGRLDNKNLFAWLSSLIQRQFDDLIPLMANYDCLVAEVSEFAAPHIAEYSRKPLIRTAMSPFLPNKTDMPPVTPLMKPVLFLTPNNLWNLINVGVNFLSVKILNKNRARLGMPPFKDQGRYAPRHAFNLLMCSRHLCGFSNDFNWKYAMTGYCFNDYLPYDKALYQKFLDFMGQDKRPALFFTSGSLNIPKQESIGRWLLEICRKHNYKLVVGCSWWRTGDSLADRDSEKTLFVLNGIIPHNLIMPKCAASIHHGGSGTTHSAARAGRPQMVLPIIADQPFWAERTRLAGVGPGIVWPKKLNQQKLEGLVVSLMENTAWKKAAAELGAGIQAENGLDAGIDIIEKSHIK